jgi:hypothetical protein
VQRDISHFFSEFRPTDGQLARLVSLLKGVHKQRGMDFGDSFIQATLIIAPEDLSRLTPSAYHLLKRCQGRVWEFKVQFGEQYGAFCTETYQELFDLLLSLGLIQEATLTQKLKGSRKVSELRGLLQSEGLSDKGKKDDLVARISASFAQKELSDLVSGIILYRTTDAGDRVLQMVDELLPKMRMAFYSAAMSTRDLFAERAKPIPELPPGVLYEDEEVRISEEDVERAVARWDRLMPDYAGMLDAELATPDCDEDEG